jgi:hypothetical protein
MFATTILHSTLALRHAACGAALASKSKKPKLI